MSSIASFCRYKNCYHFLNSMHDRCNKSHACASEICNSAFVFDQQFFLIFQFLFKLFVAFIKDCTTPLIVATGDWPPITIGGILDPYSCHDNLGVSNTLGCSCW